jgi:sugar-phosphatase
MTNFEAIIFDMDGLLIDSEPLWAVAERAIVEQYGHEYDEEFQKSLVGMGMDDFVTGMSEFYQFTVPHAQAKKDILGKMQSLIPDNALAQAGARELVQFVHENNLPRAVASSSALSIIHTAMHSMGWQNVITTLCSGEEVQNGKPAPDVYLLAAERLSVDPTKCLALEDSPRGAQAAVSAGMTCYGVPDPHHTSAEAFADVTPHVFNNLHEVLATLK